MRLEHDEKEAQAYACLLCDQQFYWSEGEEQAVCPHCGKKDGESIVLLETLDEEENDRAGVT